jgi:hypothetical protein
MEIVDMGLDTYASASPEEIELSPADRQAFIDEDIHLGGVVFRGSEGSFRGKIYARLIMDITEVDLYQEWIPPALVKEMYLTLQACDPVKALEQAGEGDLNPNEIIELRKFFKVCSVRGLGLVNSW